ncbi:hypothetical protein MIMGU_mgv1a018022mg, partial [Erythranthe guttata]
RSKAGTSSPTTFLNASITNFRALVQQHTSRSGGGNNGSISNSRKGPITLCFDSSSSISTIHAKLGFYICLPYSVSVLFDCEWFDV